MAIYHLHVGIVSRKTGRSSVAAAAYRSGKKLHNEYDGITHDYTNRSSVSAAAYRSGVRLTNEQGEIHDFTNKRGVVYSEIMLPENAPREYLIREILWNAVEKSEKRYDAQTARDIDVALPIEFDRQEQIDIMRKYIQENFVDKGMIADFAIHDKGDGNPHAHILLTTRNVDKKGFGGKNRDWNKSEYLHQWRKNWADICNERLQKKGFDERIDHRTLEAQGINREPTIHIGVTAKAMERKGIESNRIKEYKDIIARNQVKNLRNTAEYMHELKEGYVILDKEIFALKQEINNAHHETRALKNQAEKIDERAKYIQDLKVRIDELKMKRQKMGFFKNKKDIDRQIQQLEKSYEQAENTFKREYKITPEQANKEIKRLENRAKSLEHLQAKLLDRLNPFIAEKDVFVFEYQRQKLLADISPERDNIHNKLTELKKETHHKEQLSRNDVFRLQSERTLDIISKQNFQEILKKVRPEQAEKLIKNYERELKREHTREFSR